MERLDTIQKRNYLNQVFAVDEKGIGGAHHKYKITYEVWPVGEPKQVIDLIEINFQKGPRNEDNSINGVMNEDLLEIVRNRLQGFQSGDFSCRENAIALTHIEEALLWLNKRADDRSYRNVLGTYQK